MRIARPYGRLEIREETSQSGTIRIVDHEGAVLTLGTLVLLHQEVIAAVTLHRELARARLSDSLFGAAVGLHLRHKRQRKPQSAPKSALGDEIIGKMSLNAKGNGLVTSY